MFSLFSFKKYILFYGHSIIKKKYKIMNRKVLNFIKFMVFKTSYYSGLILCTQNKKYFCLFQSYLALDYSQAKPNLFLILLSNLLLRDNLTYVWFHPPLHPFSFAFFLEYQFHFATSLYLIIVMVSFKIVTAQ